MHIVINKKFRTKIFMFFALLAIKLLYLFSVEALLPNFYLAWSFDKNVNFDYLYIELIVFAIVSLIYLHYYKRNCSYSFLSTLLFIMFFVPVNSGLVLSNNDPLYYFLINIYALILIIVLGVFAQKDKREINKFQVRNIFNSKNRMMAVRVVLLLICLLEILYDYSYNGLDFSQIFSDMYDTRGDYTEFVAGNENSLMGYFILILRGITTWTIPIYIYLSIKENHIFDVALGIFCLLADFAVSMEKSTLLILAIIIFIFFLEKTKKMDRISEYTIFSFLGLFVVIFIEKAFTNESFLFSLLIRRMLYIPSYLNSKYYEFFSISDKLWFRQDIFLIQNILSRIIPPSYTHGGTIIISENVFDGILPSPNTGLFGEGYAQMGVLGVFIFPFIVAYIAKLLKNTSEYYGDAASLFVMAKFALKSLSVFLLPSFTSVGILSFIGLTYFLRYTKVNREKSIGVRRLYR